MRQPYCDFVVTGDDGVPRLSGDKRRRIAGVMAPLLTVILLLTGCAPSLLWPEPV